MSHNDLEKRNENEKRGFPLRNLLLGGILVGLIGFIGFLFFSLGNDPAVLPSELKGKPLPEFTAYKLSRNDATAEIMSNHDIKGPALLNVWATWCENCEAEHATLNELGKQGVKIYGFNYKDDNRLAYEWLQRLGNPYIFTYTDNSGKIGIELGVYGAPETFFLDKNNRIVHRHVGEVTPENWERELRFYYEESLTPMDEEVSR